MEARQCELATQAQADSLQAGYYGKWCVRANAKIIRFLGVGKDPSRWDITVLSALRIVPATVYALSWCLLNE